MQGLHTHIQRLFDAIADWTSQLKKLIGKIKVSQGQVKKFKLGRMVSYGR